MKRSSIGRRLVFVAITLVALLGFLEGLAGLGVVWRPHRVVDYGSGFSEDSRLFVLYPDYPGYRRLASSKRVWFPMTRFLDPKPKDTLRLAILGGSSVAIAHDELLGLAERLRLRLEGAYREVEFIEAGGVSYGTARLVRVLFEVLEYQPDMVLIYSGHNEFLEAEVEQTVTLPLVRTQRLLARSGLYRFLRDRVIDVRVAQAKSTALEPHGDLVAPTSFTKEQVAHRMTLYSANLTTMIEAVGAAGVGVVIGPVPSNLLQLDLLGRVPRNVDVGALMTEQRYAEVLAVGRENLAGAQGRRQASDVENAIIRAVAREHDLTLADVEKNVVEQEPHGIPGETLFNDHCHLNEAGLQVWSRTFEEAVVEELARR